MLMRSDLMKVRVLAAGKYFGSLVFRNLPISEALEGESRHRCENQDGIEVGLLLFSN